MSSSRRAADLLLIAVALGIQVRGAPRPIDVCQLGQKLSDYRTKVVAVRGEFFSGRHGATVGRERCANPSPFIEFGPGIAINLAYPSDRSSGEPPVTYKLDRESLRRFEERISAAEARKKPGAELTVTATFVGVLRVRSNFRLKSAPNGGYIGNGYGHLGRYPAELVMHRILDVEVTTEEKGPFRDR